MYILNSFTFLQVIIIIKHLISSGYFTPYSLQLGQLMCAVQGPQLCDVIIDVFVFCMVCDTLISYFTYLLPGAEVQQELLFGSLGP
jgi:hypothetical protein